MSKSIKYKEGYVPLKELLIVLSVAVVVSVIFVLTLIITTDFPSHG